MTRFEATLPDAFIFSFESQQRQFAPTGPVGFQHLAVSKRDRRTPHPVEIVSDPLIHCFLWRSTQGELVGILYYYVEDIPPYEEAGNINIYIHPDHRRQGIASRLLDEARMVLNVNLDKQRYSGRGAAFMTAYARRMDKESKS